MKKKVVTNTYLREAEKYQLKLYLDEDDFYLSVKKLIHVTENFVIRHNITVMADGYYIVEVIPKNENYALRMYLNDKKEVIEYYFDVIKESGLTEDKVPYFLDLYLDITTFPNGETFVFDEDELIEARDTNDITEEDYLLAHKVKDKLLKEIENKENQYINMDYTKYLGGF